MTIIPRVRFRTKIGVGLSVIVLMVSVLMGVTFSHMATHTLMEESRKWGRVLAENLALRIRDPMLAADLLRINNMLDELNDVGDDFVYAFVQDGEGNVLAHTFSGGFPIDLLTANSVQAGEDISIQLIDTGAIYIYDFAVPIIIAGDRIGEVRLGLSRSSVQMTINRLMTPVIYVSAGTLLVAMLLATFFARHITRRVNQLRRYAESVVTGEFLTTSGPRLARNCWEVHGCTLTACPAHGDTKRRCWYLAGNLNRCEGEHAPDSCAQCCMFKEHAGDEIQDLAETFDVMAHNLRLHLNELHAAEKGLRRQQQLMRTILDANPDLVCLQDEEGRYLAVNKAFAAFVDREADDIIGLTDADLFPADEASARIGRLDKMFATGRPEQEETRITHDGREAWRHVMRVPVRDSSHRIMAVLWTSRDVTQLKNVQDQLIQAQKMESVGKLAGGVAHEINTPLGIIMGYAQLLQEELDPDSPMLEDLRIMEKQTKVCRKIVADLLGFSRRADSTKQPMCFNNSLMEAVTLVRHTFSLDKVEIVADLDERMPIIYGDPEKLKQVWVNLLNNARDAMPEGGIIAVSSVLDYGRQEITAYFADTGTGIPPEHMKQLFDPFFSTKPVGKGTGLGLSVSFGIIKDHSGVIGATSPAPADMFPDGDRGEHPGPGALFHVQIPLDHSEDDEP